MRRTEPTMKDRIKVELMHQRERMRQARYAREFVTIYEGNKCAVCGHGFMTGVLCRKHRGNVCEKHCPTCEHYEVRFDHCLYGETEPADMRKWKLIYGCTNKDDLWSGIYSRELIMHDPETAHLPSPLGNEDGEAVSARARAAVAARTSPKYIVGDEPDENGDYAIVDADTGEISPFVAKYLENIPIWAAVEYLPPGA